MNENQCAHCGTPASPGAKYCESCGAPLGTQPAQAVQPTFAPASGYQAPRTYVPHVAPPYQGVAIRFVAILIDTIIIAIIGGILSIPFNALAVITNSASGTVHCFTGQCRRRTCFARGLCSVLHVARGPLRTDCRENGRQDQSRTRSRRRTDRLFRSCGPNDPAVS